MGNPIFFVVSEKGSPCETPITLILPAESLGWQQTSERHTFGEKRVNNQV